MQYSMVLILTNMEKLGDLKARAALDKINTKLVLDLKEKLINETSELKLNLFSMVGNKPEM